MGFLDKKTRLLDVHLTELGRQLMAQNQLVVAHYAFSDELVDYSGSLSQSIAQSASIDDVVFRNHIPIECTSMGYAAYPSPDLPSFLYTCPEQRDSLPPFKSTVSGSLDINRVFENETWADFINNEASDPNNNNDFVIITQRDDTTVDDREAQFVAEQNLVLLSQSSPELFTVTKT